MKHRSIIALVAAGALALAACGDDDDSASTTTTVAAGAEVTTAASDTEAPEPTSAPEPTAAEVTVPAVAPTEVSESTEAPEPTAAEATEPSATTEATPETTEAAAATTEATPETTEATPETTEAAAATTEATPETTEAAAATTEATPETTEATPETTEAAAATTEATPETTEATPETTEAAAATTEATPETTEATPETTEAAVATTEATEGTEAASSEPASSEPAGPDVSFPMTPGPDWPDQLVFTFTPSQEAGGIVEEAQPLAEMLEERLGVDVEPIVASDYPAVAIALKSGEAQIAGGLGPIQMVQAEDDAGADLILQSERDGQSTYVTQWFTNDPDTFCSDEPVEDPETGFLYCNGITADSVPSDGPIGQDALANVADQSVAFVSQGSASGYLIPAIQLSEVGIDPVSDIDPQFAGSHDGAVLAVYNGDATVGVSFNDARTVVADQFPDVGEKVVVFAWSSPIPNDGFAVSGDLPQDLRDGITAALLDIASTPEGQEVLDTLYEITALVPADPSSFDFIRDQLTVLDDLIK